MVDSDDPKQGHLTIKGIDKMRSAFVSDIFKDELSGIYQHKEEIKEKLKAENDDLIGELSKIKGPEKMNELMLQLHESLKEHKGKTTYGYLPKGMKAQVDDVMSEIEKIPEVSQLLKNGKNSLDCSIRIIQTLYSLKYLLYTAKHFDHLKTRSLHLP